MCTIHAVALTPSGECYACRRDQDDIAEAQEARLAKDHYRDTAPAELTIQCVDGGAVQRFRVPGARRR
jgi:hypothetical protein